MKRDTAPTNHEVTKRIKTEYDSSSVDAETALAPYELETIGTMSEASSYSILL
jgi:hypothetical protein